MTTTSGSKALNEFDARFLFYYSVSLVLHFAAEKREWTEDVLSQVIDRAGKSFVRKSAFQHSGERDVEAQAIEFAGHLRATFDHLRRSLNRLAEIGDAERDNATFTLLMMYLRQAHPGALTLIGEGQTLLLSKLVQYFGATTLSADRYVDG